MAECGAGLVVGQDVLAREQDDEQGSRHVDLLADAVERQAGLFGELAKGEPFDPVAAPSDARLAGRRSAYCAANRKQGSLRIAQPIEAAAHLVRRDAVKDG